MKDKYLSDEQCDRIYNESSLVDEEFKDNDSSWDEYKEALYKELKDNPCIKIIGTK